ncbi:MAG: B12-binding domain-containing protein, partial [Clostridia bacterium]|nr:B12-binding domain-containing protein [Clostridia bacterium]
MADKAQILAKLKEAVEQQEPEMAEEAAREAISAGIDPIEAIEEGLAKGMNTISQLFDEGEIIVPEIILSAEAFMNAVAILEGALPKDQVKVKLKVIVHTVQ